MKKLTNKDFFLKRRGNFILAALCFVGLFPSILDLFFLIRSNTSVFLSLVFFGMSVAVFSIPFFFFKKRTAVLINTIFLLFAPFEIASLIFYKVPLTQSLILLILQTNLKESSEIIFGHLHIIILYILILFTYIFCAVKFIRNTYLFEQKHRIILATAIFSAFIGLYVFCFIRSKTEATSMKEWLKVTNAGYKYKLRMVYPINLFISIDEGLHSYKELNEQNEGVAHFVFEAKKRKEIAEREIYIFVIGETARYSNFSINGYERETNPLLYKTENLTSYSNVYSQANLTAYSLPTFLTRATATNFDLSKKEKTVVDAFKEAGFSTYWIANQLSEWHLIRSIGSRADGFYYDLTDFEEVNVLDENMWCYLNKVLEKKEAKQFIVIHTLGSHFKYNMRYPDSFKKFSPDLSDLSKFSRISKKLKTELINSYDNSILYTDYFLANTIEKLKEENAISYLFYVSDHGENLYDDEEDMTFHGTIKTSKWELHVPLILWTSDEYKQVFNEKVRAINENKDEKLSTTVVFHSLLDMADISIKDENINKSISNFSLNADSIRYVLNVNGDIVTYK